MMFYIDTVFNLNIPLLSYILVGVQISVTVFLLLYLLRPLRMLRRLPVYSYFSDEIVNSQHVTDTDCDTYDTADSSQEEMSIEEVIVETPVGGGETEADPVSIIQESSGTEFPKVSIVVYSTVNEEVLTEFLKQVCQQDYPDYEVIVVCDASFETSGILSEKYAEIFSNVYVTFIPPGSHNLSRRKLALTLGIKAATGSIIVTTVANAVIPSDKWLATLVVPFCQNPEIEISLGYSRPDFSEVAAPGRKYKEFFALLTDARWIGYALMKKPYRGDGANLAFKRDLFFRCKGYSKTMHLHTGEDDLFVNDNATGNNTAVAIAPESIITTVWGEGATRMFSLRRSQYDFTARWLPLAPFVRGGAASLSQWVIFLCGLASALIALPNLIPAITAAVIWIAFMVIETSYYRKAAEKLEATRLSWQLPLFWLVKPINNFFFRAAHRGSRFKNFTWQRHKLTK